MAAARRVDVAPAVYESANERFGEKRLAGGQGSEYEFVGGPLAAAVFAFREFDALSYDLVPVCQGVLRNPTQRAELGWGSAAEGSAR
jgi:hypothetical protein